MNTVRQPPLALIYAITLTGILGNTAIAPALPDILDDFGRGDGSAGVLIAATSLPGVVIAPIIGITADRMGRRIVLVTCLSIYGSFGLAAALAPSFELLVVARFGMGIGAGGLVNLAVVLIGDHWDGPERTKRIGRNTVVLTLGLALVPPFAGLLTDLVSWRLALSLYGLALVTAAVGLKVLGPDRPDSTVALREQLGGLGRVARRPDLLAVFAAGSASFMLIFGVFLAALPLHLEEEFGYGAAVRGTFLALPALPTMLMAFNLGRIRAVLGTRAVLGIGGIAFFLGFAAIGATELALVVVLGCFVYGLGEGLVVPTLQDLAVTNAPEEHRGAVVALFVSATRLGQTIGPLGAAAIYGATSTFVALRVGAGVALALALWLWIAPIDRRRRSADPGRG